MMWSAPIWRMVDWLRHVVRSRHMDARHALGRRAEDLAHRYLQRLGYMVIQRNWRCRSALFEVDVIAWDDQRLAFVEVKGRTNSEGGAPERNVDRNKRVLLRRAAGEYCRMIRLEEEVIRFDVIQIVFEPHMQVDHIVDAFGWRD